MTATTSGAREHLTLLAQGWQKILLKMIDDAMENVPNLEYIGIPVSLEEVVTNHDDDATLFSLAGPKIPKASLVEHALATDEKNLIEAHVDTHLSALGEFHELAVLYESFPWAFVCLLHPDPAIRAACMAEIKEEFTRLLDICQDANTPAFILANLFYTAWQCYLEPMYMLMENRWTLTDECRSILQAYHPLPCQSVGCERGFMACNDAQRRHGKATTASPGNVQAVIARAVEKCYPSDHGWLHTEVQPHEWKHDDFGFKQSVWDSTPVEDADLGISLKGVDDGKFKRTTSHNFVRSNLNTMRAIKVVTKKNIKLL